MVRDLDDAHLEHALRLWEDGSAGTILKWESVPGASSYKVIRGMVVNLREAGDFIDLGPVACLAPDTSGANAPGRRDAEVPPAGGAFLYLAAYNDGQESGYGSDTAAKPRIQTSSECD